MVTDRHRYTRLMACRHMQFGMKFFLSTAGALVLLLALQANFAALRDWRLLYGCGAAAPVC